MDEHQVTAQLKLLAQTISKGDNKEKLVQLVQEPNVDVTFVDTMGNTALHLTLKNSNFSSNEIIEVLNILIARGVDPNIKNLEQQTVLHLAVEKRLKNVIDFLLNHNAKTDVADSEGNSIAHFVVKDVWVDYIRKLKDTAYKISAKNDQENATEVESAKFVEWLVSRGFNFDAKNNNGQSALHLALEHNLQYILPILLKHTQDINFLTDNRTLLHTFLIVSNIAKGNGIILQSLYPTGLNKRYLRPKFGLHLRIFSKRYDIEIIRIMLERGVSVDKVDKEGLTVLHLVIEVMEKFDIIEMLLERFTNINDSVTSLVHAVIRHFTWKSTNGDDYFKLLSALITKAAKVDSKEENSILVYYAVKYKNLLAYNLLKENNIINLGVITKEGNNLFHALAEKTSNYTLNDHDVFFDILLPGGCDIHAKNNKGRTPLYVAILTDNIIIARKLIEYGVDVNCQEYETEWSPLHVAVDKGSLEAVKLLLENGAKVNSQSRDGRPLHMAIKLDSTPKILEVLLNHQAYVNARDKEGNLPIVKALHADRTDDVEQLLSNGADINDICVIQTLSEWWKEQVHKALLEHSIKLTTLNLSLSEDYQKYYNDGVYYQEFYEDCQREVQVLRDVSINANTSLYCWLSMNLSQRRYYSYNEDFQNLINLPVSELKKNFPQYYTVILAKYREIFMRKSLMATAKEAWLKLIKVSLPDVCLQIVFSYLDMDELFKFSDFLNEPLRTN